MVTPQTKAQAGEFRPLRLDPDRIYGLGLTYREHARETGVPRRSTRLPEIFRKAGRSLADVGDNVRSPSSGSVFSVLDDLDGSLSQKIQARFPELPVLLDYEVELGFITLDDVQIHSFDNPAYSPPLGYFLANDLTARTVQVLGEGQPDRMKYWSAAKSFPGFLPTGSQMWVPPGTSEDRPFHFRLTLRVNGEVRQSCATSDLIYTPREMLRFIADREQTSLLPRNTAVLTGTPPGVALQVSAWRRRILSLLPGRIMRLSLFLNAQISNPRYLRPGDAVEMEGGILGSRRFQIVG